MNGGYAVHYDGPTTHCWITSIILLLYEIISKATSVPQNNRFGLGNTSTARCGSQRAVRPVSLLKQKPLRTSYVCICACVCIILDCVPGTFESIQHGHQWRICLCVCIRGGDSWWKQSPTESMRGNTELWKCRYAIRQIVGRPSSLSEFWAIKQTIPPQPTRY